MSRVEELSARIRLFNEDGKRASFIPMAIWQIDI